MAGFWSSGLTHLDNASTQNNGYASGGSEYVNGSGASSYDPTLNPSMNAQTMAALQKLGWSGGNPYIQTPETYGEYGQGGQTQMSPEFQAWMQQNGVTPSDYESGNGANLDFNNAQGLIGSSHTNRMQAPEFMAAAAAGFGGFGALGAGLTPLSAGTDLAQAGAGSVANLGAFDYPMGAGGDPTLTLAGNADKAALYGSEGYGAAASPAEMAGGAAGGAGAGSGVGSALDSASSWMKNNPMLTNIGGAVANGLIGAYTSNNALNKQTDATNQANALWAPYRDLGNAGVASYKNLLQNPGSITSDPGYQFGLNQGQTAIDHSAASKGGLYSGATLKALNRYGQDYGGTKLDQTLQRYGNAAQLGATGTQNTSNNLTNLGQAGAGAAMYNGNVLQNGVNNTLGQFNYANGGPNPYGQTSYAPKQQWQP